MCVRCFRDCQHTSFQYCMFWNMCILKSTHWRTNAANFVSQTQSFARAKHCNGRADERAAIEKVFKAVKPPACPRSPVTSVPLPSRQLQSNRCSHLARPSSAAIHFAPGSRLISFESRRT